MALFPRAIPPRADPLLPDHAAACAELHAGAFAHGWSELDFERLLSAESSLTEGLFDGRTLVGFLLSRVAADEAEVLTIVVAPKWRGRGLARDMVRRHLARLAQTRVRTLFLDVNEDNAPARALYARAGFTEVGRRPAYYPAPAGGRRLDALILRRAVG